MRFFTIASLLVSTAHIAFSAPIDSVARRAQDGGGAVMIPILPSNAVVQRHGNEEQDLLVRDLLARFSDEPHVLFTRTWFKKGAAKSDPSTSGAGASTSEPPKTPEGTSSNIFSTIRGKFKKKPRIHEPEIYVTKTVTTKEDPHPGEGLSSVKVQPSNSLRPTSMAHPGSQDTTFEPQKSTLSSSRVSSSVVGDQKKLRKMTSKPNLNSPKLKASLKSLKLKTKLESPPPLPPRPHQSQPNLNPQASNEEEQRVSDQAPSLPDWRPMSPLFPTFPTFPTSPRRGTT